MARIKKWPGGYVAKSGSYIIQRERAGRSWHFSTKCKTLDGAMSELARWEKDPDRYVSGQGAGGNAFEQAVEKYLVYSQHTKGNSSSHVVSQAAAFDNLSAFFATRGISVLEQIIPAVVEDYLQWRRAGWATAVNGAPGNPVGPHSLAIDVAAIKAMLAWASRPVDQGGFLATNPLERMRLPKRPRGGGRLKTFDMAWWEKVREHLSARWRMTGDVLMGSSMRYSSLQRLTMDDVDTVANTITLRGNMIKGRDGKTLYVTHRTARRAKALAMSGIAPGSSDFNHALARAAVESGLPYFSCHCFRHTSASMAIEDGVSLADLQSRLAHASPNTTEIYVHRLGRAKDMYRGRI